MIHTSMSIDSGAATAAAIVPLGVDVGVRVVEDVASTRQPIDIIDVSRPHVERTFLQVLLSFAGAAAISATVPFVVLLIGLPLALAIRGLLEVITWLFGIALL